MPIYRLMRERNFDAVLRNAIAVAFECALVELNVQDREGPQAQIIANTVLELVETGEHDAFGLRRRLIKELNAPGARLQQWASATAMASSEQEQKQMASSEQEQASSEKEQASSEQEQEDKSDPSHPNEEGQ